MNLRQQAETALAGVTVGCPARLDLKDGPRQVNCDLIDVNTLACEFPALTLSTPELAGASLDALKATSARLVARLTYLLEPISQIEADGEHCVVQLRSSPPKRDENGSCYYELLVRRGGDLELRRWRKRLGESRAAISCIVTREVLTRLIGDFDEAVDA